ncbi:MAG: ABC transporter permease [Candidatus Nanopelagicales bacterium]
MGDLSTADVPSVRRDTPWEYRSLIWNFTRRDLKARYRGTTLGWLWSLAGPLATIAIYSLVFSFFFRVQPPPFGNGRTGLYAIWLITGLVTWTFLNMTISSGIPALTGNANLLQKVYFPSFVPVLAVGLSVAIQSLIELGVVLLVLLLFLNISWTWLLVPLWAVTICVLGNSVAYLLAVANARWRDIEQIMRLVLQLMFFLTPIIYPITLVPEQVGPIPARTLVELNPFTPMIGIGRDLIYNLTLPSPAAVAYLLVLTVLAAGAATYVSRRWGRDVAELL